MSTQEITKPFELSPVKQASSGITTEELVNAITHGAGAIGSIFALVVLILRACHCAPAEAVVSAVTGFSVFGASMIILYCMSTLYHAITHPKAKRFFRVMDHNTIFFLIAGTYTPITLTILRGALGWTLFGVVWGAAVVGIVLNSVDLEKFRKPSVVCYIAMGWVIVIAIRPLLEKMDALCLWLLVAGGVFYTVGVIFYAIKKVRYFHSVWHIFVLMGSLCHYLSILFAILP